MFPNPSSNKKKLANAHETISPLRCETLGVISINKRANGFSCRNKPADIKQFILMDSSNELLSLSSCRRQSVRIY